MEQERRDGVRSPARMSGWALPHVSSRPPSAQRALTKSSRARQQIRPATVRTTSVVINLDKTRPIVTATPSPIANAAGWNNGKLSSRIARDGRLVRTRARQPDTTGNAVGGWLGPIGVRTGDRSRWQHWHRHSRPESTSIRIKPVVSVQLSPGPNANGWNTTPITAQFTCSDIGSGIATCPPTETINTEGCQPKDYQDRDGQGGNVGSVTSDPFSINLNLPAVKAGSICTTDGRQRRRYPAASRSASGILIRRSPMHVAVTSGDTAVATVPPTLCCPQDQQAVRFDGRRNFRAGRCRLRRR